MLKGKPVEEWKAREVADSVLQDRSAITERTHRYIFNITQTARGRLYIMCQVTQPDSHSMCGRSTARVTTGQRVSLNSIESAMAEERDGQKYWVYEHLSQVTFC